VTLVSEAGDVMSIEKVNAERAQRRAELASQMQDLDDMFLLAKVTRDEHARVRARLEGKFRSLPPVSPAASLLDAPPLSPYYERLLRHGNGSEVAYKVAFGALCAGWGQEDLRGALLNPVNTAGQDLRKASGDVIDQELAFLWRGAERYASEHADRREQHESLARVAALQGLADATVWKGESQLIDLMTLHAFLNTARLNCKLLVGMSARTLSDRVGTTPKTANLSLRRLVAGGWLRRTDKSRGRELAADYELSTPYDALPARLELPPIPDEFLSHPAFYRHGLGKASLRTLQLMSGSPNRWWRIEDLSELTFLSPSLLRRRLNELVALGFVDRDDSSGVEYRADFYDVRMGYLAELATQFGTDRTRVDRHTRTALERRGFTEVVKKRPEMVGPTSRARVKEG
jgi:hypothetical protein